MKKYTLLLAMCIVLCFYACKKDSNSSKNNNQLTGKWYEQKMEIHLSNGTAVDHDTIFNAASFTKNDYFQFANDMKAVFSQSGDYSITGKAVVTSGGTAVVGLAHFNYSITGKQLKLEQTDTFPSNINNAANNYQLDDIVQLDATHLVLHTNYTGPAPFSLTSTMYFTKGN
jgi:hypothetical protein